MITASISPYLDTRRKTENDTYPLKIRVYFQGKTQYYHTGLYFTEDQYKDSYLTEKPKGEQNKKWKIQVSSLLVKANKAKEELSEFSFKKFERKFLRKTGAGSDVFYYYEQYIQKLKTQERVSSAMVYELSSASIKLFLEKTERTSSELPFEKVTPELLDEYEKWMVASGKSITTVGIYLRALRAMFNQAIAESEISSDTYPFGKRKYLIPAGINIKKAIGKPDLKKLLEYPTDNEYMQKARAFWFFSYVCNGMNMRDIADLKFKNLHGDSFTFIRSKTKNTTKTKQKHIQVHLTDFAKKVIEEYGNKSGSADDYVFPIFNKDMNEEKRVLAIHNFTRFVNQHIKNLAKLAGVDENISTYWARHSFTTVAVHGGASLELIQESLGHSSIVTTMNYFKGFEEKAKREVAEKLMNF